MAQSVVALFRLRAEIPRRTGDDAACRRFSTRAQPSKSRRHRPSIGRAHWPRDAAAHRRREHRRMNDNFAIGAPTVAEDVFAEACAWRDAGHDVALATVVTTWGSSPRPVGSQLAVDAKGRFVGSVSGGCIEDAVIKEA